MQKAVRPICRQRGVRKRAPGIRTKTDRGAAGKFYPALRGSQPEFRPSFSTLLATMSAVRRTLSLCIGILVLSTQVVHAQTVRPKANNYQMPTDVQAVGGGEEAVSTFYMLDDTIGESNIGFGRSNTYDLNAGYRQTVSDAYLSISCDDSTDLGTLTPTGQKTGNISCTVITDAEAGYNLAWVVATGSGGTNTGYLINEFENTIAPFNPTVVGTPQTWSITNNDARWGGRLSSTSTDTDSKWGTDSVSEKYLNVGTGSYTVVSRNTRTSVSGSTEVLQFRAEIGSTKIQAPGLYKATVTLTASAL